jgi:hypothetical protein
MGSSFKAGDRVSYIGTDHLFAGRVGTVVANTSNEFFLTCVYFDDGKGLHSSTAAENYASEMKKWCEDHQLALTDRVFSFVSHKFLSPLVAEEKPMTNSDTTSSTFKPGDQVSFILDGELVRGRIVERAKNGNDEFIVYAAHQAVSHKFYDPTNIQVINEFSKKNNISSTKEGFQLRHPDDLIKVEEQSDPFPPGTLVEFMGKYPAEVVGKDKYCWIIRFEGEEIWSGPASLSGNKQVAQYCEKHGITPDRRIFGASIASSMKLRKPDPSPPKEVEPSPKFKVGDRVIFEGEMATIIRDSSTATSHTICLVFDRENRSGLPSQNFILPENRTVIDKYIADKKLDTKSPNKLFRELGYNTIKECLPAQMSDVKDGSRVLYQGKLGTVLGVCQVKNSLSDKLVLPDYFLVIMDEESEYSYNTAMLGMNEDGKRAAKFYEQQGWSGYEKNSIYLKLSDIQMASVNTPPLAPKAKEVKSKEAQSFNFGARVFYDGKPAQVILVYNNGNYLLAFDQPDQYGYASATITSTAGSEAIKKFRETRTVSDNDYIFRCIQSFDKKLAPYSQFKPGDLVDWNGKQVIFVGMHSSSGYAIVASSSGAYHQKDYSFPSHIATIKSFLEIRPEFTDQKAFNEVLIGNLKPIVNSISPAKEEKPQIEFKPGDRVLYKGKLGTYLEASKASPANGLIAFDEAALSYCSLNEAIPIPTKPVKAFYDRHELEYHAHHFLSIPANELHNAPPNTPAFTKTPQFKPGDRIFYKGKLATYLGLSHNVSDAGFIAIDDPTNKDAYWYEANKIDVASFHFSWAKEFCNKHHLDRQEKCFSSIPHTDITPAPSEAPPFKKIDKHLSLYKDGDRVSYDGKLATIVLGRSCQGYCFLVFDEPGDAYDAYTAETPYVGEVRTALEKVLQERNLDRKACVFLQTMENNELLKSSAAPPFVPPPPSFKVGDRVLFNGKLATIIWVPPSTNKKSNEHFAYMAFDQNGKNFNKDYSDQYDAETYAGHHPYRAAMNEYCAKRGINQRDDYCFRSLDLKSGSVDLKCVKRSDAPPFQMPTLPSFKVGDRITYRGVPATVIWVPTNDNIGVAAIDKESYILAYDADQVLGLGFDVATYAGIPGSDGKAIRDYAATHHIPAGTLRFSTFHPDHLEIKKLSVPVPPLAPPPKEFNPGDIITTPQYGEGTIIGRSKLFPDYYLIHFGTLDFSSASYYGSDSEILDPYLTKNNLTNDALGFIRIQPKNLTLKSPAPKPTTTAPQQPTTEKQMSNTTTLKVGDLVESTAYGKGRVVHDQGTGNYMVYWDKKPNNFSGNPARLYTTADALPALKKFCADNGLDYEKDKGFWSTRYSEMVRYASPSPFSIPAFKHQLTEAGYRVAATQLTLGVRRAIVSAVESKGASHEQLESVANFLDSDAGVAIFSIAMGFGLPHLPKIGNDVRAEKLAKELRVLGMTTAGNAACDLIFKELFSAIQKAVVEIPEETVRVEEKEEEVESVFSTSEENGSSPTIEILEQMEEDQNAEERLVMQVGE